MTWGGRLAVLLGAAAPAWAVVHERMPLDIPMRDGELLAADLYVPPGNGPWPVVLIQTPYDREYGFPQIFQYQFARDPLLKSPDYAFVVLDWRGFHGSESAKYPGCPDRGEDGYDAVEWIAGQPWCDGNVGTWGASALGNVQMLTAAERPPHLRACVPMVYHYREWYDQYYPGGVYARNRNEFIHDLFGGGLPNLYRLIPLYGPTWEVIEATTGDPAQINVPMLHVTGWYDHETLQTIREMEVVRCTGDEGARGRQKLLIGPWSHSNVGQSEQGQRTYSAAEFASSLAALEFLDHHLRKIANDYAGQPVVRYFRMNDDAWRGASAWPPATALAAEYYLTPEGGLSVTAPSAPGIFEYAANPLDPVPTVWGAILSTNFGQQGPGDVSSVELRADVLTFTTPVLDAALSIEGAAVAHLWIECDAADTDLAVRMTEVLPDGRSMLLVDGMRRASLRNGFTAHEWLQPAPPGTVYGVAVELPPVAVTIPAGHALRVSVGPSNYDRFDVNMQDGSDLSDEAGGEPVVAAIRLHVGPLYASRISLPIADARAAADLNADEMVDAADLADFAECLAGPNVYCPAEGCPRDRFYAVDFDFDGDADARDFAMLQRSTGRDIE